MNTPIRDFALAYARQDPLRLHVPGHKGGPLLGPEPWDLTEMAGADDLYHADGIIRQSEENAGKLFGCPTFYSAEGSSLAVRAMVHLAALWAQEQGLAPHIAAARNVHKSFLSAAALLDIPVTWLSSAADGPYLSCQPDMGHLEALLSRPDSKPTAVYLTSPDYLGAMTDVAAVARICHRHGVLLLVDCAHGAYLRFLPESLHPADLGADLCCTSAHKTLPVLTGGAYLHIHPQLPPFFSRHAKRALALFGSSSPSYLILQSLDCANVCLAESFPGQLADFLPHVRQLRRALLSHGYSLRGDEPLKLTLAPKAYGYTGQTLDEILQRQGIVCEFSDPDFLVLMLTPAIGVSGLNRLCQALCSLPRRAPILSAPPGPGRGRQVCTLREAILAPGEEIPAAQSVGRILDAASMSCPPAVPIVMPGQEIDDAAAAAFAYYGISSVTVLPRA